MVDFNRNVYLKRVQVDNLADREREVRLFFHFNCHLWGINVGDTAYFEPQHRALVHYKGRRYFWICGQAVINIGYVTGLLPVTGIPLPFISAGGTSLLIVVGVAMDTVNQVESQLIMRHYEGFTPKSGRIRGRRW